MLGKAKHLTQLRHRQRLIFSLSFLLFFQGTSPLVLTQDFGGILGKMMKQVPILSALSCLDRFEQPQMRQNLSECSHFSQPDGVEGRDSGTIWMGTDD
jgi:hypothetical protein